MAMMMKAAMATAEMLTLRTHQRFPCPGRPPDAARTDLDRPFLTSFAALACSSLACSLALSWHRAHGLLPATGTAGAPFSGL
jgi:hypothetical protein